MKKGVWIVVAALLIFGGGYFGSPYLAARNIKEAAISGDADKLDAAVDFPLVRESLKSQMSALLMKKMNSDSEMKGNPFSGLGMMMIPTIVDRMVDSFVTSDCLSALVRGQKPNADGKISRPENPDPEYNYQWVSLDRFRVKLTKKSTMEPGPSLLFERRGIVSWKLIKLELPDDLLARP